MAALTPPTIASQKFTFAIPPRSVTTFVLTTNYPPAGLTIISTGGNSVELNWNYGTLQSATNPLGPYGTVTNAPRPYLFSITNGQQFYRIKEN
jgi:hypothetical protein